MKSAWIADSQEPTALSGVATFDLNGESVKVPFATFKDYFAFVKHIEQEVKNARWHGRVSVLKEIARIEA